MGSGLVSLDMDMETGENIVGPGEEFIRLTESASKLRNSNTLVEDIDFVSTSVMTIQDKLNRQNFIWIAIKLSVQQLPMQTMWFYPLSCSWVKHLVSLMQKLQLMFNLFVKQYHPKKYSSTSHCLQYALPYREVGGFAAGMGHLNAVLDVDVLLEAML